MQALPQIVYLCVFAAGWGISLSRYGQPKRDRYDIVDVLVAPALALSLMWWGGFFTPLFGHG